MNGGLTKEFGYLKSLAAVIVIDIIDSSSFDDYFESFIQPPFNYLIR